MKVYIGEASSLYLEMFLEMKWESADTIEEADVVVFTGGADVNPLMYCQDKLPSTRFDAERDQQDEDLFEEALANDKPMVGICRGAQFLNVKMEGSLFQDVDGHKKLHKAVDPYLGLSFDVTSTHHQMMIPGPGAEVLLIASESTQQTWRDEEGIVVESVKGMDIEALVYREDRVLCYQPHPERVAASHPCQEYFFKRLMEVVCVE